VPIACPYCDHRINLKSPKPGNYRPKCPACGTLFVLMVLEDPAAEPQVRALARVTMAPLPGEGGAITAPRPKAFKAKAAPAAPAPPEPQSAPIAVAEGSPVSGR
jgi:hypothetical protein